MPREVTPPNDQDAEEAVIGSALIDSEVVGALVSLLRPEFFFRDKNQWVWQAIVSVYEERDAVDQVTVAHELEAHGKLELTGGAQYLAHCMTQVPPTIHAESYAPLVRDLAFRRKLIELGQKMEARAEEAPSAIQACESSLAELESIHEEVALQGSRQLTIEGVAIHKSNPPMYELRVRGEKIVVTSAVLLSKQAFKKVMMEHLDFIPVLPSKWDDFVNGIIRRAQKIEAPAEASPDMLTKLAVEAFFGHYHEAETVPDLNLGGYIKRQHRGQDFYFFAVRPMMRWLRQDRWKEIAPNRLWTLIEGWGGVKHTLRIKDQARQLLGVPCDFAEDTRQAELPEWF